MANFVTVSDIPTNPFLAGLTTEPANPNPVRLDAGAPITYAFDDSGARAWTLAEKSSVARAFGEWSKVANIDFAPAANTATADDIFILTLSEEVLGETTAPADGIAPQTVNISTFGTNLDNLETGGDSFSTLVHEIGHTLGLYHPHSGTLFAGVPLDDDQNRGTDGQNQQIWTIMSYAVGWENEPTTSTSFGAPTGPMTFDIAAVQMLYGARAAETGNTVYTLPAANDVGTGWDAIWDTGGQDTISGAAATTNLVIDLREAPLSGPNAGGYVSWINGIKGGYTIANGVVIENAIGGSGADTLTGNTAANTFTGGGGDDTIDGSDGRDIAVFNLAHESATIARTDTTLTITGEGTDTLTNVERLLFTDGTLAFDFSGNAGQTYRLYQAAFARTPDTAGLSSNVNLIDTGAVSFKGMADAFAVSGEFQSRYGADSTDTVYINALYNNVLGRDADAAGLQGWMDALSSGSQDRGGVLIGFSESSENIELVAPAIDNGIWLA